MTHEELLADVEFTLSPAGRERREDREIAFAEEIMRMRRWLEGGLENDEDPTDWTYVECALNGDPAP
jgi:hypothetical protein